MGAAEQQDLAAWDGWIISLLCREKASTPAGEEEEGYPSKSSRRIKWHLKVSLGCSHAGNQRDTGRAPASAHHSIGEHLCLG